MANENGTSIKDRISHGMLWGLFFGILTAICLIAGALVSMTSVTGAIIVSAALFLGVTTGTLVLAYQNIPQEHVWLLEIFGKYRITLQSGLHFLFPYLGFIAIKEVYLGEQQMELYMDESVKEGFGFGDVEFTDISARVKATVYFRIVNPFNAVYRIENIFRAIEEKMDSTLRSFLGQYSIDQANIIKVRAKLKEVMNGEYIDADRISEYNEMRFGTVAEMVAEMKKCDLWNRIYTDWGAMVTAMALSDIVLTQDIKDARRKVLEAQKRAEAAIHDGNARKILAKSEKAGLSAEGEGYAKQIELLTQNGLNPVQAAEYLAERMKWVNVGTKGATVIVEGGGGATGFGARFAAGFQSTGGQKPATVKEPPKENNDTDATGASPTTESK